MEFPTISASEIEKVRIGFQKPKFENGRKLAAACAGSPQTDGPVRRLPYKIFGVEKEKGGPGSGRGAKIPARSPEGLLDSSARYS